MKNLKPLSTVSDFPLSEHKTGQNEKFCPVIFLPKPKFQFNGVITVLKLIVYDIHICRNNIIGNNKAINRQGKVIFIIGLVIIPA